MTAKTYYTIYDPITEQEQQIIGGPWCFYVEKKRAYIVFPKIELAQKFIHFWTGNSNEEIRSKIIDLQQLGDNYEELIDNVELLLLLSTDDDVSNFLKDIKNFPYNHYLIPRFAEMKH